MLNETLQSKIKDVLSTGRIVFCNPGDIESLRTNVLSKDIKLVGSNYLLPDQYLPTHDVIVKAHIKTGVTNQDFIKNEMTVYVYHTFS